VRETWKALILISGLLVIYGLITMNWLIGTPSSEGAQFLRFSSARVGAVVVAGVQLLPAVAFWIAVDKLTGRRRVVAGALVLPLLLFSLPLLLVSTIDTAGVLKQGYSNGMVPLGRVDLSNGRVSLYQTNGGATTAYGVLLRYDRQVLAGVRLTRNVKHWYPADTARLLRIDDNVVAVEGVDGPATFSFDSSSAQFREAVNR
jgi:hypothetical protein